MSYCEFARTDPLHKAYHDELYGFPLPNDNELFGRLLLEINQAGLSWTTILKKQEAFRRAYAGYDIDRIAAFDESDRQRLLNDAGIIRNRLKIDAAIHNAQQVKRLRDSHGSFEKWLDAHHPRSKDVWVKLFKKTFRFTGGEIVNEFLMSTGYLAGAHVPSCPYYEQARAAGAAWARPTLPV